MLWLAAINDMITGNGKGNPELANLPRKLNIGLSPSRDDFPHTHINDVGLKAVHDPETGEVYPPFYTMEHHCVRVVHSSGCCADILVLAVLRAQSLAAQS